MSRLVPVVLDFDKGDSTQEFDVSPRVSAFLEFEAVDHQLKITLIVARVPIKVSVPFEELMPLDDIRSIRESIHIEVVGGEPDDLAFAFSHNGRNYETGVRSVDSFKGMIKTLLDDGSTFPRDEFPKERDLHAH